MFDTTIIQRFMIGAIIGATIVAVIHIISTALNKRNNGRRRPIEPTKILIYLQKRRERKIKRQLSELIKEYITEHPDIKTIKLADLGYHTEVDELGVNRLEENYITIVD